LTPNISVMTFSPWLESEFLDRSSLVRVIFEIFDRKEVIYLEEISFLLRDNSYSEGFAIPSKAVLRPSFPKST
jgi:hypothetical protein